jgi:hypothetical protein
MDKLIANASVGLAKASMNRRGFLGRLAGATGGAAVLAGFLAKGVSADHCGGSHFCVTGESSPYCGICGIGCSSSSRATFVEVYGVNCYTGEDCPKRTVMRGCGCTIPNNPCLGE